KWDVGQLMKFSCVIKSTPPIETIQATTVTQKSAAGATASRLPNARRHERCCKMSPNCSTVSAPKQAKPNSSLVRSAADDHNPAQNRLIFFGLRAARMANRRNNDAATEPYTEA